jgi:hypothetical protein
MRVGGEKSRTIAQGSATHSENDLRIDRSPSATTEVPLLKVKSHIASLRGGSQPHLVACSNGCLYVLKTVNNPQGPRVLANELLAYRLGKLLNLPLLPCAVLTLDWLTAETNPQMTIQWRGETFPCQQGLAFGSKYLPPFFVPTSQHAGQRDVPLPRSVMNCVENKRDFLGMLVFDAWTLNLDKRQVIYSWRTCGRLQAYMIDNGFSFCGGRWDFPEKKPNNLFDDLSVYAKGKSVSGFEPWLSRLENEIDYRKIEEIAATVPLEWCPGREGNLSTLAKKLDERRPFVRRVIESEYVPKIRQGIKSRAAASFWRF